MVVNIVGCTHHHQRQADQILTDDQRSKAFERNQKRRFRRVLVEIATKAKPQLIAEEIEADADTIPRALATELQSRYANIDMHSDERLRRGIPRGYADRGSLFDPQQIDRWHRVREQFMLESFLAAADGLKNAMVVCGYFHAPRLAELLHSHGHETVVTNIAEMDWFSEDWVNDPWHYEGE